MAEKNAEDSKEEQKVKKRSGSISGDPICILEEE